MEERKEREEARRIATEETEEGQDVQHSYDLFVKSVKAFLSSQSSLGTILLRIPQRLRETSEPGGFHVPAAAGLQSLAATGRAASEQ